MTMGNNDDNMNKGHSKMRSGKIKRALLILTAYRQIDTDILYQNKMNTLK